jgi:hypothetical protein
VVDDVTLRLLHSRVKTSFSSTVNDAGFHHSHSERSVEETPLVTVGNQSQIPQSSSPYSKWVNPDLLWYEGMVKEDHLKLLRWSRGSVLAFGTQVRGFKPGRSRRIFQGEKNPQHAFLRRGSKSRSIPCRRFAACKRTLKVALTRSFQAKFTGHFSPNSSTFHC